MLPGKIFDMAPAPAVMAPAKQTKLNIRQFFLLISEDSNCYEIEWEK
jgi:hypothetical protein